MPYYSNVPINREFMKYKPRIFEYDINYSGLFNKLSQKTNKKIKIVSLVLNISNPVVDYCDSSQLILMCIYYIYKHNNYNYLKELIGYYKLTYDQLEQIVKFYTKMGFNMKLKKEIKELF